jgi:hypothetical protein
MNPLATARQLPRQDSFCTYVVDSKQILLISDTLDHPAFATSFLTQRLKIRAYLGVPLITSSGDCVGTLAVMDVKPREFPERELEFLELTARWSMSEYERQGCQPLSSAGGAAVPSSETVELANRLQYELLGQLTQELCTPLTSVMGMTSVLRREIYGPLTVKQKEYLDIIHHSGQYLLSLVHEILELSHVADASRELNLTAVDIEMLCQQAINTLEQAANRREQQIHLSVEPGHRIWFLDKDKVRQLLYHLIFNLIQTSTAGSVIRLHVSRRDTHLNIAAWVSHPWLGEGLPAIDLYTNELTSSRSSIAGESHQSRPSSRPSSDCQRSPANAIAMLDSSSVIDPAMIDATPVSAEPPSEPAIGAEKNLGFRLGQQLATLHGGTLTIHGSVESGYRYLISLPQIALYE